MQQLQCDVCGGKLVMADNRQSAQCENCGVEYSLNAMKDMIAALQGVELKVQGVSTAQSLVDYAYAFIDENVEEAKKKYKEALEIDPKNYQAWKGLFDCVTLHESQQRMLFDPEKLGWVTADNEFFIANSCSESYSRLAVFHKAYMGTLMDFHINIKNPQNIVTENHYGAARSYLVKAIEYAPEEFKDSLRALDKKLYHINIDVYKEALMALLETHTFVTSKESQYVGDGDYWWYTVYTVKSKKEAEEEAEKARKKLEENQRLKTQKEWIVQGLCRHCGGEIGGLFTKKCKSCGKAN